MRSRPGGRKIALATPCGTPWCAVTGVDAACTTAFAFMLNAMPVMQLASETWPTASGSRSCTALRRFVADHADRADVERVEQRVAAEVEIRLGRVRERIGAGRRDDRRGRREHELGVDDRDRRGQVARCAHDLEVLVRIGDHDDERDLGAGAAGRRDADHGRPVARHEVAPAVVPDRAAVLDQRRRRPWLRRASCRRPVRRCRRSRARGRARRSRRDSRSSGSPRSRCSGGRRCRPPSASVAHAVDGARAEQALVGDEHDRAQTELRELLRQAGDRARAVVHARRALEEVDAVPGHRRSARRLPAAARRRRRRRRCALDQRGRASSARRRRGGEPAICCEQRVDGRRCRARRDRGGRPSAAARGSRRRGRRRPRSPRRRAGSRVRRRGSPRARRRPG